MDKILELISKKLKGINYAFIGSVNLYIQGVKVKPRDVDILTTSEEIKKIDQILKEFRTKEIYFDKTEGRNSYRSFYQIKGIEIEVLGNVDNFIRDPKSLDRKIFVKFNQAQLPCILLEDESGTYKKMGRLDKVAMIEETLDSKRKVSEANQK